MSLEPAFAEMCELVGADVLEGVERTRTADLISSPVIIEALRGFTRACQSPYLRGISAPHCCVLHRIAFPAVSY